MISMIRRSVAKRGRFGQAIQLATGILWAAAGCTTAAAQRAEQTDQCLSLLDSSSLTIMTGSEGASEICSCAVDSLAARFPDAADRWAEYTEEVENRFERRGIIGLVADTTWLKNKGGEMGAFVAAHGEVIATCTQQLIQTSADAVDR
jgi:hypothetical protein